MVKLNFPSSPHILEPINLLSIEAYQTRMKAPSKMNYYTSVAAKCGFLLTSPDYKNETSDFIARCCHFHGCQGTDFSTDTDVCHRKHSELAHIVSGKGKKWIDTLTINHYSRSLEKYALKQKTWKTSSGEAKPGETAEQAASSYDIPKFLARSVGFHYDDTALRYSCQLRDVLAKMTGEKIYLRPGSFWYKNPEYGKTITDPDKRGRYGRENAPGFRYSESNPNNYHGGMHGDVHVDHSEAEKKKINDAVDAFNKQATLATISLPAGIALAVNDTVNFSQSGGGGSMNVTIQQHIMFNINSSISSIVHHNGHQKEKEKEEEKGDETGTHVKGHGSKHGNGRSKKKSMKINLADTNSTESQANS